MSTIKTISKFLSLLLRHKPETVGLMIDANGWTSVSELIEKVSFYHKNWLFTMSVLEQVVAENDKKRFSFNADKTMIRAAQGHSVAIDIAVAAVVPPDVLYHGTASTNVESIMKQGLVKGKRQHVHLSKDEETATKVGTRHGKPIIFAIKTLPMQVDGVLFYLADNGVWLVDEVAAKYLELPL